MNDQIHRAFTAPPLYGDTRSQLQADLAAEEARERQRLAGIALGVAYGCTVTVGTRTWHAGEAISSAVVGDADFWAQLMRRGVIATIPRSDLPAHCPHGRHTHVTIGPLGSRPIGSRVCAACFDEPPDEAQPEVLARFGDWRGTIVPGTPPVAARDAVDGREVLARFVRSGRVRELGSGER